MSDLQTLLPPSATPNLRAIETVMAERTIGIEAPLGTLWNVDDCPSQLLPWLAWAFSVEVWDARWPEEYRRRIVREAVTLHRQKGTKQGCERALAALGMEAQIEEWFEYGGRPGTFRVVAKPTLDLIGDPTLPFLSLELRDQVTRVLKWAKPVRAHFDLAFLLEFTEALAIAAGGTARHRAERSVAPAIRATGETDTGMCAGCVAHARARKDVAPSVQATGAALRSGLCGFRATHRQRLELEAG